MACSHGGPYRAGMGGRGAAVRDGLVGAGYVALCAGLAVLVVRRVEPTVVTPALLVLLLPLAAVVFVVAFNVVAATDGVLLENWVGALAFVVLVAVAAGLQAWMVRTTARNWRTSDAEMRTAPVSGGPDSGC